GLFSVAPGKKVRFSQGNLQYTTVGSHACADGTTKAGTWRFAAHQYDIVFNGNDNISSNYTGWIDLFGWGTSGYNKCYPYLTTTDGSIYGPSGAYNLTGDSANYDWGVYNAISNGGNVAGKWRTLTKDEWEYLLKGRDNASSKIELAMLNGTPGVVLLPDSWAPPSVIDRYREDRAGSAVLPVEYPSNEWCMMENAGAVFLPLASFRDGTTYNARLFPDVYGRYWSSVSTGSSNAHSLDFSGKLRLSSGTFRYDLNIVTSNVNRSTGQSVRLVCDEVALPDLVSPDEEIR
ncbi:MAG: hypothetical protein KBT04_06835, partial [Bacteroidales bacterium]|nr:hypothetical protein [Candidatus Colimorpha onthohippi]